MKVVILAGGFGTRISEETTIKPKPMVDIGDKPILWHIMKVYASHGLNDFVICLGYKGYVIKEFFANYFLHMNDVSFDLKNNKMEIHNNLTEPWTVTLIDTGENSMTGGRIKRVKNYIDNETFCLTYGDGLSNVDIKESIKFHKKENATVTLTAVQPAGRFGAIALKENQNKISTFSEKPKGDGAWINGGFFVVEPEAIDHITDDSTVWEREPLQNLAHAGKLSAYKHNGFWQSMDTLRDKNVLEKLWQSENPPWKTWV